MRLKIFKCGKMKGDLGRIGSLCSQVVFRLEVDISSVKVLGNISQKVCSTWLLVLPGKH